MLLLAFILNGHVFVCVRVCATMSTLFFLLAMDFSYAKFHVWLNDVVLFSFVVMCVSVCAIRVERELCNVSIKFHFGFFFVSFVFLHKITLK